MARGIVKCEGTTHQAVRDCLQEMELTIPYCTLTIRITSLTTSGPLHKALEKFLSTKDRTTTTWPDVEAYVEWHFLSSHEKQSAFQDASAFARRYSDPADVAYPGTPDLSGRLVRKPEQKEHLIRYFRRGLADKKLVEWLIIHGRPRPWHRTWSY